MKSIRGRLLVTLLTGLAVVLVAGNAAVYWVARASLTRQFDAGLNATAHTLAALVKLEPVGLVFETSDAPAATMAEAQFELRTLEGRTLKRSENLGRTSLPVRVVAEGEVVIEDVAITGAEGRAIWFGFLPRVDPDDWQGRDINQANPQPLVLIAVLDRTSMDRALLSLTTALCIVGVSVGIIAGVLVVIGVAWGLSPLDHLRKQLADVAGESLNRRQAALDVPVELAPVYQELNSMLDRVARTLERERSFADAAAHELRSPLTELRAIAEIALKWPDPSRALDALRQILAVGREMERLVEALLMIARDHVTETASQVEDVSVAKVVRDSLDRFADVIQAKGIKVQVDFNGRPIPAKSFAAVEIIVRNLIDNAVRYTMPQGVIVIQHNGHESQKLVVENGPVQLTSEDIPHLFQPFWRKDRSRSDREHVGLGLTVVERMSRTIGLNIEAALIGNRLRLVLRAPPDTD